MVAMKCIKCEKEESFPCLDKAIDMGWLRMSIATAWCRGSLDMCVACYTPQNLMAAIDSLRWKVIDGGQSNNGKRGEKYNGDDKER